MINIPFGVYVLCILFMFLVAGMLYEAYIRPKFIARALKVVPQKAQHEKQHVLIK